MKRSLVGHQNLTAEIMELEQTILSTFSKTLPDILGSDILESLRRIRQPQSFRACIYIVNNILCEYFVNCCFMFYCFYSLPALAKRETIERRSFAYSSAYSASTRKERGRCRELGLKKVEKCLQTRLSTRAGHSCKRDVLPSVGN